MTFGDYLKDLRQAKGISQKELSGLTKGQVSNAEISRLEAGIRKKPSPAVLKVLAPYLGVPMSMLLTRAGYMDSASSDVEGEGQGTGFAAMTNFELDSRQAERILSLEAEMETLRKQNRQLEASYRDVETANKILEEKCDYMLIRGALPNQEESELVEENRQLKERAGGLKEQAELLSVKQKQLELANQDLEAENLKLGAEKKGWEDIYNELLSNNQQSLKNTDALEEENRILREKNDGIIKENLELSDKNDKLEWQIEENTRASELTEESNRKALDDELLARDRELESKQREMDTVRRDMGILYEEKMALEQELAATKKTVDANIHAWDAISAIKVDGVDLDKIFSETAAGASAEDLDTLGRLMQAMHKDAIRSSDKKMLLDILKRFMK